jgi:predicted flap endonuclease-1-like 5' DNA nuclease
MPAAPRADAVQPEELSWEVVARDARLAELEGTLRHVTDLEAQIGELERRIVELRKHAMRIPSLEARIVKLEEKATQEAQVPKSEPPAPPDQSSAPLPDSVPPAPPDQSSASQPDSMPPPSAPRTDNLRAIRGIGRAIEHSLHGLGIRTFDAIAAWTAEDVERFAAALGLKPERIRRDRWVQRAQEQVKSRTGPPPDASGE